MREAMEWNSQLKGKRELLDEVLQSYLRSILELYEVPLERFRQELLHSLVILLLRVLGGIEILLVIDVEKLSNKREISRCSREGREYKLTNFERYHVYSFNSMMRD